MCGGVKILNRHKGIYIYIYVEDGSNGGRYSGNSGIRIKLIF